MFCTGGVWVCAQAGVIMCGMCRAVHGGVCVIGVGCVCVCVCVFYVFFFQKSK